MLLTAPDHASVLYVVANMRAIDKHEIYNLRHHENPFHIVNEVMARPEMTWVAWTAGEPSLLVAPKPAVVFGGIEAHPGVWQIHCFGTDDWPKLAIPLTRFVKRTMLPMLFGEFNAHRLEADSIASHVEAHRWMEICGAHREGVKKARGRDRSDYFTYVILGLDAPNQTK